MFGPSSVWTGACCAARAPRWHSWESEPWLFRMVRDRWAAGFRRGISRGWIQMGGWGYADDSAIHDRHC